LGPVRRISPSSSIRTDTPGTGWPTVPILLRPGRFTVEAAVVSVSPYPSMMVIPAPRKKWPSRSPRAPPPDTE
jgi:hypothetical protein